MSDINVRTLSRLLQLRRFPLFEHADLDELATIAENLIETKLPAGSIVATAGSRLRSIHLVIDGQIENLGLPGRSIRGTWVHGGVQGDFLIERQ